MILNPANADCPTAVCARSIRCGVGGDSVTAIFIEVAKRRSAGLLTVSLLPATSHASRDLTLNWTSFFNRVALLPSAGLPARMILSFDGSRAHRQPGHSCTVSSWYLETGSPSARYLSTVPVIEASAAHEVLRHRNPGPMYLT